jgi:hypothetical protein
VTFEELMNIKVAHEPSHAEVEIEKLKPVFAELHAGSVRARKLLVVLVYEALHYWCVGPSATGV